MANLTEINTFYMKANPPLIDFSKTEIRNFQRISMKSDTSHFYSYCEVYFKDEMGIIIDKTFFVEGLEFDIKYGNDDDGYLENTFAWSENQVPEGNVSNHVSGVNAFILLDNAYMGDNQQSRSWNGKTASEIALEVAQDDFNIDSNKIFISDSDDRGMWYQANEENKIFLKRLSDIAYSKNAPNSPYLTFINTAGEFYFMTVEEMLSTQQPVKTLKFKLSEQGAIEKDVIKNFQVGMGGLPVNFPRYKQKIYSLKDDGSYTSLDFNIEDHVFKEGKEKCLVRSEYQKLTHTDFFGIFEDPIDETHIKGKVSSLYRDTAMAYRMTIVVDFDPKLVTGKVINIEAGSAFASKQVSTEYSGKWLIIDDELLLDEKNQPYQSLRIAKSAIKIDTDHPFYNDFL